MKVKISVTVNGTIYEKEVEPRMLLVHFLREELNLTGTHVGCDTSSCGACTVHLDGKALKSCTMLAVQANGRSITTIEGLSSDNRHPLQQAWNELDVPQCGYCQPGIIMSAAALLKANPNPSDADIDASITNICRCGTYNRVRDAVKTAAKNRRDANPDLLIG